MSADSPDPAAVPRAACVVVAAGRGERLAAGRPKALVDLDGLPLLVRALEGVRRGGLGDVVVVAPEPFLDEVLALCGPQVSVVAGGSTRQQSVLAGLGALRPDVEVVLVHDAARCLTPSSVFVAVLDALAAGHRAVVPGVPVTDTLRRRSGGMVDRDTLVAVQTPQGFVRQVLEAAHRAGAERLGAGATDDAGLVEALGVPVHLVAGHEESFKVTGALDLVLAEGVLVRRRVVAATP